MTLSSLSVLSCKNLLTHTCNSGQMQQYDNSSNHNDKPPRLVVAALLHVSGLLHLHVAEDDMLSPVQGIYADLVPAWYAQVGQSLTIVIVFTVGLPHPAFVLYR